MKRHPKSLSLRPLALAAALAAVWTCAYAFQTPSREPLPDFDLRRLPLTRGDSPSLEQSAAVNLLGGWVPDVTVDFEPLSGSPRSIASTTGFLTGPGGVGKAVRPETLSMFGPDDPYRIVKAFIFEERTLFGYGPEVLDSARVSRDYTTPHNGLRTVVWDQQVQQIRIYDAALVANVTKQGELVNLSSQFIPNAAQAVPAATPNNQVIVSARKALVLAAQNIGVTLSEQSLIPQGEIEATPEQRQLFRGQGLKGDAEAKFIWVALDRNTLRLCWDVIVMSRERGEMFRIFVDASSGQLLRRQCLTRYLTDASYRVWTSDSPSPMSPGYPTPVTTQPPIVDRTLVTLSAFDTNASPAGWIPDGGNETLGNNVDAHTDRNADDVPDLPRPHGSPARVFDIPVNLATQDPTNYSGAAVVQLFYLCNYYHDRLYELGFTEAAGNFQSNNFGRGGLGNDPVQADAQDGSGFNNANFSTPPDGSSGRMQMYLFTGPSPRRDGDFDAEVVFHEHTHGLSWRMVAGGQMLGTMQSDGMGEGWSDFYGLSLLSEAGDDVNGNYGAGAYVSYKLTATFLQNYYFGIRRYPYTTDMTKNPLTFKDIDPAQADYCSSGAPVSAAMGCSAGNANEVHNEGEVWCVTLWEARANLVNKYGWAVGNQLMLQLVTDGMRLTPAHPNFLQARDGILQADLVDTGGANRGDLWAAFAKRGMGASATSPSSSTTTGVHESFDIPDDLQVIPGTGLTSSGQIGGPFTPACQAYALRNNGAGSLGWAASATQPWVSVVPGNGILLPGTSNNVTVCLTTAANALPVGTYSANVLFSNTVSHVTQVRQVALYVAPPRVLYFPLDTDPGWTRAGEWAFGRPTGGGGTAHGFHDPTSGFTGSNVFGINLSGDYSLVVGGPYYLRTGPLDLSAYTGTTLQFKRWLNSDYPPYVSETIEVSPNGGTSWSFVWSNPPSVEVSDRAWTNVSYNISAVADGRTNVMIRWGHRIGQSGAFAYSGWNIDDIEILGTPTRALTLNMPTNATEGDGVLLGAGRLTISAVLPTNLVVTLSSSDTTEVTVPPTVIVPAGQTNVVFDVTIVDDNILDGTQTATITATAPGYASGRATIAVADNETATLQVLLPASVTEGAGIIQGTLLSSATPAANFTVHLSSSDTTEIQVPATVVLPAGQTSVVFNVTVVDDNLIDGPQIATVTAHVPGWTDGSTQITVLDNENLNLVVNLPAMVTEGAGLLSNAGHVSISGLLPTNLVVTLGSDNLAEVVPSASATIVAGQVTANFDLLIGHDPAITGAQTVNINANAPGFTSGFGAMVVLDYESPPPPTNPAPANLATNVPASTSLSWSGGSGDVTNDVYFGTNAVPGPAQLLGSTTDLSRTLPLLDPNTTYFWKVVSRRGGVTSSAIWRFTTRGVDHFVWSNISSPQWLGLPFSVNVTAQDELGRAVANFSGTVNLSGWAAGTGGTNTVPITPTVSGPFVNGAWAGNLTVQHTADSMWLRAEDGLGHSGSSAHFNVGVQNDLSLTMTATPNPVTIGGLWTNTLVLSNIGPTSATGVFVTNVFPATADFSSAATSQGTYTVTGNTVVFDVGTLADQGLASFELVVAPAGAGLITNSAVVVRGESDADPSNNTAFTTTLAVMPMVSINSVAVYEGNNGWTPMLFTLQLLPPTPKEVWVSFTTVDGTATAGSDYFARAGLVKFAPYETNETLRLYVFGDTNIEPNETFSVVLSDPVNAELGTAVGTGTIINDDFPPGPTVAYLRSTAGLPWGSMANEGILTQVFATNWEDLRYETVSNIGTLFSPAKKFIFMEGGDVDANALSVFLGSNLSIISNWVAAGGSLFVNAAPNLGGNINLGFGALLTYPDFCSTAQAVYPGHQIFNGPYLPVGTNFTGSSFGHATVSGGGLFPLISDASSGHYELAERVYGAGHLMFGGMTLPIYHLPEPQGSNLLANILFYGANVGGRATNLPPSIFGQPASVTAYLGSNVTFSVFAFGSPPLSYSWYRNGAAIGGAVDASYTLNNVQLSDSGAVFSCLVSNLYGTALSSGAVLTVLTGPPQPVFLTGNYVYLPIETNGVFIANSTGGKYNPAGTGGAAGVDFWWPGTPVYNYGIGVGGMNYFNGAFQSLTLSNASSGSVKRAVIDATVTAGLHFRRDISFGISSKAIQVIDTLENTSAGPLANVVRLDSTDPDQDALAYNTYSTLNDVLSVAIPNDLVVATGPSSGLSLGLGSESGFQVPSATGFNNTNAYDFLSVVDPNGASADIAINLAQNFGQLDAGTSRTSVWYLVFGSSKAEVLDIFAGVVGTNVAPIITGQPVSQTVTQGGTATFSITALGSSPLTYSWRRNGQPLPGATDSTYSTNNVQLADSGAQFSCLVSNAYGTTLSSSATLTVLQPPAQVFLAGSYLYLPIETNGVFIANSTGGKFNAAGTGGASGVDFWYPGTPVYNYVIAVAGSNYVNGQFQSITVTNLSAGGVQRALIDANVTAGLHFTRDISFAATGKSIKIIDTLQNTGAAALLNVVSLDSTDPDQDAVAYSTYNTLNDVLSIGIPNDLVVATGPSSGLSLGFGSDSTNQVPSAVDFNNTNAYAYLTVVDPNGVSADIAINLAQNYGQLDAGTSRSTVWYMVFGSSKMEVTNAFALLISTNLVQPSFSRMWVGTGGDAHFEISGSPGRVYNVFGSTNLVEWELLSVVTNLNGVVPFVDPAATNYMQRFYRCVER